MTDLTASLSGAWSARKKVDWVWAFIPLALLAIAAYSLTEAESVAAKMSASFLNTAPFILFAISATAYLKAADAEGVVAKAFTGPPARMIVFASFAGGLSPFCSCEVIPFIAALLAMGAPLSAVMAFWLASPLMDPPMFAITTGALGLDFAVAKTLAAVGLGLMGGFGVLALGGSAIFADPLRPDGIAAKKQSSCCGSSNPFNEKPFWPVWKEAPRRAVFAREFRTNGLFLAKWLLLAYLIEAVMIRWVPANWIATFLGGDGVGTILLAAVLGAPAYLNGYAAAPLAAGLIEQGMNPGAAMSFLLAGGVTCIPAAVAVFSLVRLRVFGAYLGFATLGSVIAGLTFAAYAG